MTILEALNMIPDPEIRARALENRRKADKSRWYDIDVRNEKKAIGSAFPWEDTPEGVDLWEDVYLGITTTWQQACEKYPHLRELPLLSEEKVVTDNVEVIQHAIEFLEANGYKVVEPSKS